MRKSSFLFVVGLILVSAIASSCTGSKLALFSSEGIFTYNRHTGQIELLWDNHAAAPVIRHDTIFVDSCKLSR